MRQSSGISTGLLLVLPTNQSLVAFKPSQIVNVELDICLEFLNKAPLDVSVRNLQLFQTKNTVYLAQLKNQKEARGQFGYTEEVTWYKKHT